MRLLVVGAGAVGTAYAFHALRGGAEVAFLVRPRHAEALRGPQPVYLLNRPRRLHWEPLRLAGHGVVTSVDEVRALAATRPFDAALLCMSSTGLAGDWLPPLVKALGEAAIVTMQPGMDDRAYVASVVPAARLVGATIPVVSYHAPLEGQALAEPGYAWWVPVGQRVQLSGPSALASALAGAFARGGLPAVLAEDTVNADLVPGTVLGMMVCALEAAGWSFRELSRGDLLPLACRAMPQGIAVLARLRGQPLPRGLSLLLRPSLMRLILWLSRFVVPFDFERYLRHHFTKVGPQMHQGIRDFLARGRAAGQPVDAIAALEQRREEATAVAQLAVTAP